MRLVKIVRSLQQCCPVCGRSGMRMGRGYICTNHPGQFGNLYVLLGKIFTHRRLMGLSVTVLLIYVVITPALLGLASYVPFEPSKDLIVRSLSSYEDNFVLNALATVARAYVSPNDALRYAKAVETASFAQGIDPFIYMKLLATESGFNQHAVSCKGYKGIPQIKKTTGDPIQDIIKGAVVLRQKLDLTHGDYIQAISLYKGFNKEPRGIKMAKDIVAQATKLRMSIPKYVDRRLGG